MHVKVRNDNRGRYVAPKNNQETVLLAGSSDGVALENLRHMRSGEEFLLCLETRGEPDSVREGETT